MCKVFLKNYESMNTYYQILLFENKLLIYIYFYEHTINSS